MKKLSVILGLSLGLATPAWSSWHTDMIEAYKKECYKQETKIHWLQSGGADSDYILEILKNNLANIEEKFYDYLNKDFFPVGTFSNRYAPSLLYEYYITEGIRVIKNEAKRDSDQFKYICREFIGSVSAE